MSDFEHDIICPVDNRSWCNSIDARCSKCEIYKEYHTGCDGNCEDCEKIADLDCGYM